MKKIKIIFIAVIVAIVLAITIPLNFNDHTYTVNVTDKERVVKNGESYYLVYCEDTNDNDSLVFTNEDAFLRFKFNSSNIQGKLKINHKYKVTVVGLRIPLTSAYENIIKVEEMK